MNERYGERQGAYDLRPRRPRDYEHLHSTLEEIAMTQYSVNTGLQIFGQDGVEAVLKELQQLHGRKVIQPVSISDLSAEQKQQCLPYLMFLKEKRTGVIKGRGCADGRRQRQTTSNEEASSPTVAIESVLLSCTIDAHELKLNAEKSEFFHHVVAQLLFLCKRARPDIQTAVAFLCTRVKSPNTDDYNKLVRVIKYLRASFAVHPDMKSHTGGVLSFGKGGVYGTSTRQKLNSKSSTEAELIGVAEVLPQILWTRYFMEAQGYGTNDSIVYQDNKSTILLENNGKSSSTKRTRHINIRYFFVTDRIANKEVRVEYCPTKAMIADFFTKPLQGAQFCGFRDFIMNVSDHVTHSQNHRSVLNNVLGANDEQGWILVTHKYRNGNKIIRTTCLSSKENALLAIKSGDDSDDKMNKVNEQ
jgi:hypothetical protein